MTSRTLRGASFSQSVLAVISKLKRPMRVETVIFTFVPSSESGNMSAYMLWMEPDLSLNAPVAKTGWAVVKTRSETARSADADSDVPT